MGLMLSVLVFCVGVVEVLDCWDHFMFHLVTPPRNVLPYHVDPRKDILCDTEERCTTPELRRPSHADICWPKDLSPTDDLHVIKKRTHSESERKHEHEREKHSSEEKDLDHHRHSSKIEVHTPDLAELVDSPIPSRENSPSHLELDVIIESDSSSEPDEPSEIENLSYKEKSSSLGTTDQENLETSYRSTNFVPETDDSNSNLIAAEIPKSTPIQASERLNITPEDNSNEDIIEYETQLPQFTDALLSENVMKIPHRYPHEEHDQEVAQDNSLSSNKEVEPSRGILSMSSVESDKFEDAMEPTSVELLQIEQSSNMNESSPIARTASFPIIKLHESSPVSMEDSSDSSINTSDASMMARSRTSDRPLIVRFAPSQEDVARDFMSVAQTDLQALGGKESSLESDKSENNYSSINSSSKITLDSAYPAEDSSEIKSISIEGINIQHVPSGGANNEEQKVTGQPETNSSSSSLSGIPQLPEDLRENTSIIPLPTDNGFERLKLSQDSQEDEYLTKISLNVSSEDGNDTTGLLNVSSSALATSKDEVDILQKDENGSSFVLESESEVPPVSLDKVQGIEVNVETSVEEFNLKDTTISKPSAESRNVKSNEGVLLEAANTTDDSNFEAFADKPHIEHIEELTSQSVPINSNPSQDHPEPAIKLTQCENISSSQLSEQINVSKNDARTKIQALKDEEDICNDIDLEKECKPQPIQRRLTKRKSSFNTSRQSSLEQQTKASEGELNPEEILMTQGEKSDKLDESNKPLQRRETKLKSSMSTSRQSSSDSAILEHGAYECGSLERFDDVSIDSDKELKQMQKRDMKRKSSLRNSRQSSSEVILEITDQPSPKVLEEKLESILRQSASGGEPADTIGNTGVLEEKLPETELQSQPLQRRNTKRKSSLKASRQSSVEDQTPNVSDIPPKTIPENTDDKIAVENELSELSELDTPKSKSKTKKSTKLYQKIDTPVICKANESEEVESSKDRVEGQSVRTSHPEAQSVDSVPEENQSSPAAHLKVQGEVNLPSSSTENTDDTSKLIFSGEYTKAMNKDWHSGHFCCWQCDESLTGQRYVLRDEHPYCIKCYESVFANGCEECNKTIGIDSKDLSYKDKHWHEACFLCNKCRVSLVDKQFGSKLDKIFCGNCYDAQFASRCDGCGQIFKAGTKKMEYKTRQWHEPCFSCCVCKTPIGTKSFIPREQEIYCATCYEEKFATRCVKCNKIITSGGVTYKNEPWHRECFTCTNCNTSLAGQRFTSRDEKPYCADCFGELFAKRCTACCKPITGIGGTRFISFEDRHWHNDCFICASCKTSLVGRGFITDAEDIICPECAKQKLM